MTADSNPTETQETAPVPPRRSFLTKFLSVVIGGVLVVFPFATGLAFFLDPLRSRRKQGEEEVAPEFEGFIKVTELEELPVSEEPHRYKVIDDRVDAWNMFLQQPVGTVYLLRSGEQDILAFNADCPHATCPVSFDSDRKLYQCPCHNSSFHPTGDIANPDSPAARGLDRLEVKIRNDNEVWIKFQNFLPGKAEQIPVT